MWVTDSILVQFLILIGLTGFVVLVAIGFCSLVIMVSDLFIGDKDNE